MFPYLLQLIVRVSSKMSCPEGVRQSTTTREKQCLSEKINIQYSHMQPSRFVVCTSMRRATPDGIHLSACVYSVGLWGWRTCSFHIVHVYM